MSDDTTSPSHHLTTSPYHNITISQYHNITISQYHNIGYTVDRFTSFNTNVLLICEILGNAASLPDEK